jgi:hypothetical protein
MINEVKDTSQVGRFPFAYHSRCLAIPIRRALKSENALFCCQIFKEVFMKFLWFFILFISYSALAQIDSVFINQRVGGSDGIKIFNSQEITFPTTTNNDFMFVKRKDGTTDIIKLSEVNKIVFGGITGVNENKFSNLLHLENYPNPFQISTNISYSLEKQTKVVLRIYDIFGNLIKILADEFQEVGNYEIKWDGTNVMNEKVSTGNYYCQFLTNNSELTKQIIIIK